jgi:hypothetical protein
VARESSGQQGGDLQTGLELEEMPWQKYLVKTQTAGHWAISHYSATEQKTARRNDPVQDDGLGL